MTHFLEDAVTARTGHKSSSQLLPYICGCECVLVCDLYNVYVCVALLESVCVCVCLKCGWAEPLFLGW